MRPTAARLAFGLALAVQVVVLYVPDPGTGGVGVPGLDKVVHAAVFAAAAWTGRMAGVRSSVLVAALAVHAGVSEVVQGAVLADRHGDPLDVVADLVGVALGALLPTGRAATRRSTRRTTPRSRRRSRTGPGAS